MSTNRLKAPGLICGGTVFCFQLRSPQGGGPSQTADSGPLSFPSPGIETDSFFKQYDWLFGSQKEPPPHRGLTSDGILRPSPAHSAVCLVVHGLDVLRDAGGQVHGAPVRPDDAAPAHHLHLRPAGGSPLPLLLVCRPNRCTAILLCCVLCRYVLFPFLCLSNAFPVLLGVPFRPLCCIVWFVAYPKANVFDNPQMTQIM